MVELFSAFSVSTLEPQSFRVRPYLNCFRSSDSFGDLRGSWVRRDQDHALNEWIDEYKRRQEGLWNRLPMCQYLSDPSYDFIS